MEAVLKVRLQGVTMPWKEVMRGCLVMVMFGILCLCVQNYAEKSKTARDVPVCGAAGYGTAAALVEADPSEICRAGKLAATDMRGAMTDFPVDLSGAVKKVPVKDVPAKNPSGADNAGSFMETGRTETQRAVPWTNPAGMANPEISVRDDPPVMDVTDVPGGNVTLGVPVTPGESVVPGDLVIPGEGENPGDYVIPGESENPGDSDIFEGSDVPEEIAGFILDEEGYITGYTKQVILSDGLLLIPGGEGCTGIRCGAFEGLSEEIWEVYIPETICDIEPGAFDGFPCLMFVEVSEENPYYFSEDGILYSSSGEEVFCPMGRLTE